MVLVIEVPMLAPITIGIASLTLITGRKSKSLKSVIPLRSLEKWRKREGGKQEERKLCVN